MQQLHPPNVLRKNSKRKPPPQPKDRGIVARTASIPTKYQTVVTSTSDKKGFNAQSKRFDYERTLNENPGPGTYKSKHGPIEKYSSSFSRKGTGSFASKTTRYNCYHKPKVPDLTSYNLPSLLTTRREWSKSKTTSSFQAPIAEMGKDYDDIKRNLVAPAPNAYFVNDTSTKRRYVIGAESVFRSTTKRDAINVKQNKIPSPCHYNIHEQAVKKTVPSLVSAFVSNTQRGSVANKFVPGPGTYRPNEPVTPPDKQTLPRKHYLCISAPALALPPAAQQPGPGTYELVNYEGPEKHYMSSGVFVSNTSRWSNNLYAAARLPGPTTYKPTKAGKQSFIYNIHSRWIPA